MPTRDLNIRIRRIHLNQASGGNVSPDLLRSQLIAAIGAHMTGQSEESANSVVDGIASRVAAEVNERVPATLNSGNSNA